LPIYEYKCLSCEHTLEKFQSVNDPAIENCPICGGKVKKVLYPAGLIFKGSGFYITDSRKETKKGRKQVN
jgi:putative FmdB family regulatory protein